MPHIRREKSMPRDTFDRTCTCQHTCKIPSTSKKSPVPISLPKVQSHMPNSNFVVAIATLVTVTFCHHNSAISCFILNETFDMLLQQETLYFGCIDLDRSCNPKYVSTIACIARAHVWIAAFAPISSRHGLGSRMQNGLYNAMKQSPIGWN